MSKKNLSIFYLFVCLCLLFTSLNAQEQLTISTYYPSPYGSYNELTVANRQAIGDVNGDGQVNQNDMAVDNLGVPIRGSLTVANNVGIGTVRPQARLEVNGGVKIGSDATCNASKAGTLRYFNNTFQYCDGAIWRSLADLGVQYITGGQGFYEDTEDSWVGDDCPQGYIMTGITTINVGEGGHNFWKIKCRKLQ